MTPYVPDVDEEDFGDLEESEEGQSPIRKSTREGSPDNRSQGGSPMRKSTREGSPDNRSQGVCSSSDSGSLQGGSASNPDYEIDSARGRGKTRGKGRTKGRGTGRGKTGGRRGSTSTVSGTADEVEIEGQEEEEDPTLILMILMMMSMYSLLLLHIVHLEFTLNDQSCGVA